MGPPRCGALPRLATHRRANLRSGGARQSRVRMATALQHHWRRATLQNIEIRHLAATQGLAPNQRKRRTPLHGRKLPPPRAGLEPAISGLAVCKL